jgi:transposase
MRFTPEQLVELESIVRIGYDGSVSARAQMVLECAAGRPVAEVAKLNGTTRPTVYKWVERYAEGGLAGLADLVPTGRPRSVSAEARSRIIALTRMAPPAETGLTHWSSYEMAKYLRRHENIDVSHNFIATLWRENDLKPHRQGTFKVSRDPDFSEKVVDVIGLYLDPPAGAAILSFDEKTQVQALQRSQPMLPVDFGKTEKRTHDYKRHGTTNLFAALDVLTGRVMGRCFDRRRTEEFVKFMNQLVRRYPKTKPIHVVMDNLSTHDNPDVDAWLAKHPNVAFHFTPTGSSWINQIETWFGIATRQAIRRGSFASLAQLIHRIGNYIDHWNEGAEPFQWTATADEIIDKVASLDRDFRKLVDNNQQRSSKGNSITGH